jgi:hypothetical protein
MNLAFECDQLIERELVLKQLTYPIQIQVVNHYVPGDPVVGAAITFDHDNQDAKTPRTAANGFVTVRTEGLTDGNHVVRITPRYASDLQVGPDIAEDLEVSVTRMFRSFEFGITVLKGKVQAAFPLAGQQGPGTMAGGTNPVRVLLQPIYHRSPHQNPNFRPGEKITLIVVHQTAGSTNIGGTLTWFEKNHDEPKDNVSSHYVISAENSPQVVKVVQDTGRAWHAGGPCRRQRKGGSSYRRIHQTCAPLACIDHKFLRILILKSM